MGLGADATVEEAVDAWLRHLEATKPAKEATAAAYRRDIEGVAARIAGLSGRERGAGLSGRERGAGLSGRERGAGLSGRGRLQVHDLDKRALRAGFASWADDHAATSVLRAHSAWSRFFDFLVAEDLAEGNPMPAVVRPERPKDQPRAIQHPGAAARLLATAAVADPKARQPWPERDLALVATFCVTGIRVGEAVNLGLGSLDGVRGTRSLVVVGAAGRPRVIPIGNPLTAALDAYLRTRAARFPRHNPDHPATALFVDARGRRLSSDQIKYLVERLYVRAGLRARVPSGALVHALRHTFAISALQEGADIVELQALLGHSSLETTRRYLVAVPSASA